MKRFLTPLLFAFGVAAAISPAHAGEWPRHGFYHVQKVTVSNGYYTCDLRVELRVDDVVFALIFEQSNDGDLETLFITGNPNALKTDELTIGVDETELITINPEHRSNKNKLPTFSHVSRDAQANRELFAQLRRSAERARQLWVGTSAFTEHVPADGLKEALVDQAQCLTSTEL